MESKKLKKTTFDDDILKAIEDLSFISESSTKCKESNIEMENEVLNLIKEEEELKNSLKDLIEEHASKKKLIAEQQCTISKLSAVTDEIKMSKEELSKRNEKIKRLEEDRFQLFSNYAEEKSTALYLQNLKEEDIKNSYEKLAQKMRDEIDALISEGACKSRELNEDILRIEAEQEEKHHVLVLDYEERLQRAYAHNVRMQDELQDYRKRANANISVYQKRIEVLEQAQHHSINIVAPNNARRDTFAFTPITERMDPDEYRPSHVEAVSNAKKDDKTAPYKLSAKQHKLQRVFKPLQIRITPSTSGIVQGNQSSRSPVGGGSASKRSKRKLFAKDDDEFQDFGEGDQAN